MHRQKFNMNGLGFLWKKKYKVLLITIKQYLMRDTIFLDETD